MIKPRNHFSRPSRIAILFIGCFVSAFISSLPLYCQEGSRQGDPLEGNLSQADRGKKQEAVRQEQDKRIFGVIPNYRTTPLSMASEGLTAKEKFEIGTQDAFDRGTFLLAIGFAGEGQLTNSNPSFGQGAKGYARYFGTSLADWVIGDYMTEVLFPIMLRQDPRYFQRGTGSVGSRLGYAARQIFWTRSDSGRRQFNFSEIAGNSTAAAISMAYYPDNRHASDAAIKLASQLGVDMAGNILKEFWPDIRRKIFRKKD